MKKAFTLLELILVMGTFFILMGLSATFYARFLLQNAVDNTVFQITEDLRKAQIYSMTGKGNSSWGVKYANNTLSLYQVGGTRVEDFSVNSNIGISGLSDVQFAKITGVPLSGTTITVSAANINKNVTITLNSMGVTSR